MKMQSLMAAVACTGTVMLASGSPLMAAVTTTADTTTTSAVNDGTINNGEYVSGGIAGINGGFGNVIGSGAALFIDSGTDGALNFGLRKGPGSFSDVAVIYLDTTAGGATDLVGITDNSSRLRAAISGNGEFSDSSNIVFAAGFDADYAIGITYQFGTSATLFSIGANGALTQVATGSLTPGTDGVTVAEREFAFTLANLGLTPGSSFDYVATYLNPGNAFRSNEFIGVTPGSFAENPGNNNTITLGSNDFNTFVTVPEPASLALVGLAGLFLRRKR
jgi:hypothetical protein